ncbi:MAG: hypothetical protein K2N00_13490 [Lachnospiraceae bacterium]|nr:hypothetical protein [Lachnospiraceae bacterium]
MEINEIGAVGYPAMYGMRGTDTGVVEKSFRNEICKAATRLKTEEMDSDKSITKMRYAEN